MAARPSLVPFLLTVGLFGCSPKPDEGAGSPPQDSAGEATDGTPVASNSGREAAINACSAVATLYPKDRLTNMETRDAVVGKHWAERDGGRGSIHGPPKLWRRSTDLTFEEKEGVLKLRYEALYESSNEEPEKEVIEKDCQICGEVMVCGETVWALEARTNEPPKGGPLDLLYTAAILELEDNDVYLIRHGHEILLELGGDPRTKQTGSLDISIRKLAAGAEVVKESTTYTSDEMAANLHYLKIQLPGDVEGIRLEYRDPDRGVGGGGYGTDTTIRPTLFEMESLKKHPDLMEQPESLEIADDAPGFNLPHK